MQRISIDRVRHRVQNPNAPAAIVHYIEHSGRAKAGAAPCHAKAFGVRDTSTKRRFLRKPINEPAFQLHSSQ
ncbi:hypothetical protein VM57_04050 [Stenotrophomonas maltophilia]|uniref:Uncharacterized protein n=1 Tax=Stenotrophomonas maltophilia TaxID=40324 RepID=A0A0F5ZRG8_STEMA|nr:hypothetical protein VM57_04050 [Stenotrophomonas maltophilia]